ncbi:MAG TPA: DNA-processing protein DprA [Thermohalobaculum sp.]|nr:DNA-processing protein DprA [Thermohalobaculum sp.]
MSLVERPVQRPAPSPAPEAAAGPPDHEERLARLRVIRSENVGPRTYAHVMHRFGSAQAGIEALPALARRGGRRDYRPCPRETAEAELRAGAEAGATLITVGEPAYPPLLAAIDSAPPAIWVVGDPGVMSRPAVGVVGARNASALGLRTARRIAADLAAAGYVVVSGLARGIDHAAHEAAVESGTVAVMAGGVDRIFPPEHEALAARIAATGALVSECPVGTEPTGRHFPRRNRLIAGLSEGVLLIEAALRSGSLITARYALDQGREVMACPGAPEDPRAGGCNRLIRDGAALIRSAADVVEALAALQAEPAGLAEPPSGFLFDEADLDIAEDGSGLAALDAFDEESESGETALPDQILRLLGPAPVETDELARLAGCPPAELSLALLELELAGRIEVVPGSGVALAAS